jgi:hypothetical protein
MYDDFKIASDNESLKISNELSKVKTQEVKDLVDIHLSMSSQINRLKNLNKDGKYTKILKTTENNIKTLQNIINTESRENSKIQKLDNDVFGKVPHDSDLTHSPSTKVQKKKWGFPMQGSIIDVLAKSLRKKNNIVTNSNYNMKYHNMYVDEIANINNYDNWHNDNCDQERKLVTNQIDILRLLVLFVALRPRCHYTPNICRMADDQMSVLIDLI